jgi:signal transduction histidine kinase
MNSQLVSSAPPSATDYVCVATDMLAKMVSDRESLEVNNRRITVAMAAAGHDLRERLHMLLGTVELLSSTREEPRGAELCRRAKSLIFRIAGELEQLAFQAEREQTRGGDSLSCFEITGLLERLKSDWEFAAAAKYLRFCIDPAAYLVESDPHLLAIILNNVVGNAVKHTPEGAVTVGYTVEERAVVIAVSDTGPGIPEEALRRSFGFCRRSMRTKEGMGIGLSIARRSAEILGHEFEISAPLSGGTVIRLHVPLAI